MTTNSAANETLGSIQCHADAGFGEFLAKSKGSVALTTYQTGQLMLISAGDKGCHATLRGVGKVMGIDTFQNTLLLATGEGLTAYGNDESLARHRFKGQYDGYYLPRMTWHFPDIGVHDIAFGRQDIFMVVSHFSCLAVPSLEKSFVPVWKPDFISEVDGEDRCHLNGLALKNGDPAYVTALAESDAPQGWRENKATGGIVMDVARNRIITRGLAMPHSPRMHNNNLYVLNSGAGELIRVDTGTGDYQVVCKLPGYLRGLTFVGDIAMVGMCKIRESNVFGGMPVQQEFDELHCGIALVDLKTGESVGTFSITGGWSEVFDMRFLPGMQSPNLVAPGSEESRQAITTPERYFWITPMEEDKQSAYKARENAESGPGN